MSTSAIPIICFQCGSIGAVQRVTAALRCGGCGSDDLDAYTGSVEQKGLASTGSASFAEFMTGKTALQEGPQGPRKQPVGGDVEGWDEYTGPRATPTQEQNGIGTPMTCGVCHGSGFDLQEGGKCRTCGGSGFFTPNTTAETPAVARHDYPSTQTAVPFMGRKRQPVLALADVACPSCSRPTSIVADAAKHGWWRCAGCGPLANLEANPHLDPYSPPAQFKADGKGFATTASKKKAGKLVPLIATIREHNPGLTAREILTLGRQTLTYARTAEKS